MAQAVAGPVSVACPRRARQSTGPTALRLAELQVRWPTIPIVFCETRPLAEEWTYRYLAAAHQWARTETALTDRMPDLATELAQAAPAVHRRPPPRSAPGPDERDWRCPTAAGSGPRSGPPGTPPTSDDTDSPPAA
jgi:hypothetical protein